MSARMSSKESNERIVRLLGTTDLFKDLAPDDLATCAASFREVRFGKGQILFGRGDAGNISTWWPRDKSGWRSPPARDGN